MNHNEIYDDDEDDDNPYIGYDSDNVLNISRSFYNKRNSSPNDDNSRDGDNISNYNSNHDSNSNSNMSNINDDNNSNNQRNSSLSSSFDSIMEKILDGDSSSSESEEPLFLDDDDDDDDMIDFSMMATSMYIGTELISNKSKRSEADIWERLDWPTFAQKLLRKGQLTFYRFYRMHYHTFLKLADAIRPYMDEKFSKHGKKKNFCPISTELALHTTIRWLAGCPYLDLCYSTGISVPSFYRVVYKCMNAILQCPELAFKFPTTRDEINVAASNFRRISRKGMVKGCVGCIDGILLKIQTPDPKQTGNVKSYFSGHYQMYGINVQAVCDSKCRFTYVSIAAPGGSNDIFAYKKTKIPDKLKDLPRETYIIGDNAYVCSEHLLTPFSGREKDDVFHDSYNYCVSQLRIRIEMAFGLLCGKWRILKTPLQVQLKHAGMIFMCCCRLHNFIINDRPDTVPTAHQYETRQQQYFDFISDSESESSTESLPTITVDHHQRNRRHRNARERNTQRRNARQRRNQQDDNYEFFEVSDISVIEVPQNSYMRDKIVSIIRRLGLLRPGHNVARNGRRNT